VQHSKRKQITVRLGIWFAILGLSLWIGLRSEFRADISAFLPRNPTPNQQLLVDQLKDGSVSRLILIGLDGSDVSSLATASKQIAKTLRADPQWTIITNGELVGAEQDGKFLLENRYLLSNSVNAASFDEASLKASLDQAKQLLTQQAGLFAKELVPKDPTGEMMRLLDGLSSRTQTPTEEGVWMVKTSETAWRALIMGQTKAPGIDLDAQEKAVGAIKTAFNSVNTAAASSGSASNLQLVLSGPGVFSAISRDRIKSEVSTMSGVATAMVIALIWWVYRSVSVMVIGLLPVVSGIIVGMATVSLSFGYVHGITMGFGATLIGEAVDYAIYLLTLIRNKPGQTALPTMERIWPTLRIGVLTSIFGFAAMVIADFPGLQQLGVFSVAGLIAAVLTARYLLPHLLPDSFEIRTTGLADLLAKWTKALPRYRWPVNCLLAIVLLVAFFLPKQVWVSNLGGVSPISVAEQKIDETLRGQLGAPDLRFLVIAEAPALQQALEFSEIAAIQMKNLQAMGKIGAFDSPTQFLPSDATQRKRQQSIPSTEVLTARLQLASQDSGFSADSFKPFLVDAQTAKTGPLISRQSLQGTQLVAQIDALVVEKPKVTSVMLPLRDVKDESALKAAISALGNPSIRLLDMTTETDTLYQTYRLQAVTYALAGMFAIFILLALYLRSIKRALRLMWPLAAAVLFTGAILLIAGVALSIFHIVAMLLVVGVGSNYALFFDGQVSDESIGPVMISLVVCNLSTIFGFGVLGFSNMPILSAIGTTVGIGAVLSLFLSALYLQSNGTD
jgi:predicted exporter